MENFVLVLPPAVLLPEKSNNHAPLLLLHANKGTGGVVRLMPLEPIGKGKGDRPILLLFLPYFEGGDNVAFLMVSRGAGGRDFPDLLWRRWQG